LAVTRLRAALTTHGILLPDASDGAFDRPAALRALRVSFRLDSVGPARSFAVSGPAAVRTLVKALHPGCIEGVSRTIRDHGAHVEQRDVVSSREATVAIRERLGPEPGPGYAGPGVLVRTASRVSVPLLAGRRSRDHLSPLLAAAALANETGVLGEIGKDVWETATASRQPSTTTSPSSPS